MLLRNSRLKFFTRSSKLFAKMWTEPEVETENQALGINPELKGILDSYAESHKAKINSILVEEVSLNNLMSDVYKIQIMGMRVFGFKDLGFKGTYRVKEVPKCDVYAEKLGSIVGHSNEVLAYTRILPKLMEHAPRSIAFPEMVGYTDNMLVLADLNEKGYQNFKKEQLDVIFTKRILDTLAAFHAASLIMKHNDPTLFSEISTLTREVNFERGNERSTTLFDGLRTTYIPTAMIICRGDGRLTKHLEEAAQMDDRILDLLTKHHTFSVLNHGDLTYNNILQHKDTHDVALLDFQMTRYTSLASDLVYFFFTNVDPKLLREHRTDLVGHYFERLKRYTSGLPCNETLTLAWLEEELRLYAPYGFIFGLMYAPFLLRNSQYLIEKCKEELPKLIRPPPAEYVEQMDGDMKERIRDIVRLYADWATPPAEAS